MESGSSRNSLSTCQFPRRHSLYTCIKIRVYNHTLVIDSKCMQVRRGKEQFTHLDEELIGTIFWAIFLTRFLVSIQSKKTLQNWYFSPAASISRALHCLVWRMIWTSALLSLSINPEDSKREVGKCGVDQFFFCNIWHTLNANGITCLAQGAQDILFWQLATLKMRGAKVMRQGTSFPTHIPQNIVPLLLESDFPFAK